MDELTRHLDQCEVLCSLTVEQRESLAQSCRLRKYPRQSSVYLPQDDSRSVMLMAAGRACLSHITSAGKQSILFFLQPGDLFGELAAFDTGEREEYCDTVSDSKIVVIPASELQQLMYENTDFCMALTRLIGRRRRYIERRLKSVLFSTTRQKLCRVLMELAQDFGEHQTARDRNGVGREGVRISIPLSHHELGNLIGATRETVTHTLGELRNDGLISTERCRLVLIDPHRLRETISFSVEH